MTHFDPTQLVELANTTMPFGKYAGRRLAHLPEPYLLWFSQKGFPENRLGQMMALALLIKSEGLEHLLTPLEKTIQPSNATVQ